MPQTVWREVYCYCSPPRRALVVRYTAAERIGLLGGALSDVALDIFTPITAFVRWLTKPADTIQMREVSPMCGRSFRAERSQMDSEASIEGKRLTDAEASRALHRSLYAAIRDASTRQEEREAVRAWDAHMAEHRELAAQVRAERNK